MKATSEELPDAREIKLGSNHARNLLVSGRVRRDERRHVNGISDGLITRRVDYIAQHLLGILNAAALLILVAQEDQLVLLAGPETAHALFVDLDQPKREEILGQHDHLVLIRVLGELMPQREQTRHVREHRSTPQRIAFVAQHRLALEFRHVLVQARLVVALVLKVILMQPQAHAHRWQRDPLENLHVGKDPLVLGRLDSNVAFE